MHDVVFPCKFLGFFFEVPFYNFTLSWLLVLHEVDLARSPCIDVLVIVEIKILVIQGKLSLAGRLDVEAGKILRDPFHF